jgi:hypothetical protein
MGKMLFCLNVKTKSLDKVGQSDRDKIETESPK